MKGLVYNLKFVVLMGVNGFIEVVLVEIEIVFDYYELIKVKVVFEDCEIK